MRKIKIASLAAATMLLVACNSTPTQSTNKPKFAWQEPDKPTSCVRTTENKDITLKASDLNLAKNDHGCFGSSNKMCDLRIYQVMTESFMHGNGGAEGVKKSWGPSKHLGNLKGVIDNLSYIKSTGANAIWLTPIFTTKSVPNQDWTYDKLDGTGYYTSDYFSIDPRFGTKEELKTLVNKAHSLGMYVFLDGVFGHAKANVVVKSPKGNELKLTRRCIDSKGYIDKMSLKEARCFETEASLPFLKEVASYWINEVKIDGWRLDQAYQVKPEYWSQISETVKQASADPKNSYKMNGKKVQPLGYMVGEIWSENPRDIERTAYKDGALMSAFNFPLRAELVKVLASRENIFDHEACSQPASGLQISYKKMQGYNKDAMPNMFLGNHDLVRFGDLLQRSGYEKEGSKPQSYYDAHSAALSFLAAYSGPITIYYGDETGDETLNFALQPSDCGKVDRCDDHVARTDGHVNSLTSDEKKLKDNVAAMMKLRDSHPALSRGVRTHLYSSYGLFIDYKNYKNDNVIYALNAGVKERDVTFTNDVWNAIGFNSCSLQGLNGETVEGGNKVTLKPLSGNFYKLDCSK